MALAQLQQQWDKIKDDATSFVQQTCIGDLVIISDFQIAAKYAAGNAIRFRIRVYNMNPICTMENVTVWVSANETFKFWQDDDIVDGDIVIGSINPGGAWKEFERVLTFTGHPPKVDEGDCELCVYGQYSFVAPKGGDKFASFKATKIRLFPH
jgi:hypothetical protein